MRMHPLDLIEKKRDGYRHTKEELDFLVAKFNEGEMAKAQMAAWLMAVYLRGLDLTETAYLTRAMVESGLKVDLKAIDEPKVDKHSTGGVGDKTTLVVVPLAAAVGIKVPKLSGGALGHTGGTLDKLKSIPGFRTTLALDEFIAQVLDVGAAIGSQTGELAPADKKIYALRDKTATVSSIPLIVASILSKKAAAGSRKIVIDVKTGTGAFMPTLAESKELAATLVAAGNEIDLNVECIISDMNQPLGLAIGNSVEVKEAVDCLGGGGPPDLRELSIEIATRMVLLGGLADGRESALAKVESALATGKALSKFQEIVLAQGGETAFLTDASSLKRAPGHFVIKAEDDGWLAVDNCRALGEAATLVSGRIHDEGEIDLGAGLVMKLKAGAEVVKGSPLVDIFYTDELWLPQAKELVSKALTVVPEKPDDRALIYDWRS